MGIFDKLFKKSKTTNDKTTSSQQRPDSTASQVNVNIRAPQGNIKDCDICDKSTQISEMYAFTTKEVVLNPNYWDYLFSNNPLWISSAQALIQMMRGDKSRENTEKVNHAFMVVEQLAADSNLWGVCEECTRHFPAQLKNKAKEYIKEYYLNNKLPPDAGPANMDEVRGKIGQILYFIDQEKR